MIDEEVDEEEEDEEELIFDESVDKEELAEEWRKVKTFLYKRLTELGETKLTYEEFEEQLEKRPAETFLKALSADRLEGLLESLPKGASLEEWRRRLESVNHPAIRLLLSSVNRDDEGRAKELPQRLAEAVVYAALAIRVKEHLDGRGVSVDQFYNELRQLHDNAPPELRPWLKADLALAEKLAWAGEDELPKFSGVTPATKALAAYIVFKQGGGAYAFAAARWYMSGRLEEVIRLTPEDAYDRAPKLPLPTRKP